MEIKCDFCREDKKIEEIYAFYPEDSTYICKNCFKNIKKQEEKCVEYLDSKERDQLKKK